MSVSRTTWGKSDNPTDWSRRIGLCPSDVRENRQRAGARCQVEKSSAVKFHLDTCYLRDLDYGRVRRAGLGQEHARHTRVRMGMDHPRVSGSPDLHAPLDVQLMTRPRCRARSRH